MPAFSKAESTSGRRVFKMPEQMNTLSSLRKLAAAGARGMMTSATMFARTIS